MRPCIFISSLTQTNDKGEVLELNYKELIVAVRHKPRKGTFIIRKYFKDLKGFRFLEVPEDTVFFPRLP